MSNWNETPYLEHGKEGTVEAKKVFLYGYDYTNLVARRISVNADGEVIVTDNNANIPLSFTYEGVAQIDTYIVDGVYFGSDRKITQVGIFAQVAPQTTDFTVDLTLNGAALSKTATLTAGNQYQQTNIADASFLTTDRFGIKITGVGSNSTPVAITIILYHTKL
jgi:hypothetical protein